ncbi:unnamed protein product [Boreogadus saida]
MPEGAFNCASPLCGSCAERCEVACCPAARDLRPEHAASSVAPARHRRPPEAPWLTDSDPHPTVRVKALYGVSCLVREQEAGLRAFVSQDGFSVLMRGMQSEDERLRTKSAFLLLNLLSAHPEQKGTVLSMGMAEQLVSVLRSPHSSFHEHVLGALCCLVEDCPQGLKDCRSSSLGLDELLTHRARDLQGREEWPGQQTDDNGMDR